MVTSICSFFLYFLFNLSLQPYEGLKLQDLRRLKDMLIVETADMLQAPLFTAEALLRAHGVFASRIKLSSMIYNEPQAITG